MIPQLTSYLTSYEFRNQISHIVKSVAFQCFATQDLTKRERANVQTVLKKIDQEQYIHFN